MRAEEKEGVHSAATSSYLSDTEKAGAHRGAWAGQTVLCMGWGWGKGTPAAGQGLGAPEDPPASTLRYCSQLGAGLTSHLRLIQTGGPCDLQGSVFCLGQQGWDGPESALSLGHSPHLVRMWARAT